MVTNTQMKAGSYLIPATVLGVAGLKELLRPRDVYELTSSDLRLWFEGGIPWAIQAIAVTAIIGVVYYEAQN